MEVFNLPVQVYFDEDIYIAECPVIQWASTSGETPEEAIRELTYAIEMIADYKDTELKKYQVSTNNYITSLPIIFDDKLMKH